MWLLRTLSGSSIISMQSHSMVADAHKEGVAILHANSGKEEVKLGGGKETQTSRRPAGSDDAQRMHACGVSSSAPSDGSLAGGTVPEQARRCGLGEHHRLKPLFRSMHRSVDYFGRDREQLAAGATSHSDDLLHERGHVRTGRPCACVLGCGGRASAG
jgi:hypothetical protein